MTISMRMSKPCYDHQYANELTLKFVTYMFKYESMKSKIVIQTLLETVNIEIGLSTLEKSQLATGGLYSGLDSISSGPIAEVYCLCFGTFTTTRQ